MKPNKKDYPHKLENLYQFFKKLRIPFRITFIFMGVASTIWFLARVIPKPSRATYPCIQAAAPVMSGFVVYLLAILSTTLAFKLLKKNLQKLRFVTTILAILIAIFSSVIFLGNNSFIASADTDIPLGIHESNDPIGEAVGIFPGRVVWAWDADATNKNCSPTTFGDGWWMDKNNNQAVIDEMLSGAIMKLTDESTITEAWEVLFKDFNLRKHGSANTYVSGEKIIIKINVTSAWGFGESWGNMSAEFEKMNTQFYGIAESSAQVVLATLRQLVDDAGVHEEDIYVGDPMKNIYKHQFDMWSGEFPDVNYLGNAVHNSKLLDADLINSGRVPVVEGDAPVIEYADWNTITAKTDKLYTILEEADYMINIPTMKAHARAGITLTAKNHYGSHTRSGATHLHPGLVAPDEGTPTRTLDKMYRTQVDIMGHPMLGKNTMLFLIDALFSGSEAVDPPTKWDSEPFNGDWTNSLFLSQDQVAIESVCFDFLRTEYDGTSGKVGYPNYAGVDDYLMQAADSTNWPDGIKYDPDSDGTPIGSLGIHEHWNNARDKQYSRNLGQDYGIELLTVPEDLVVTFINNLPEATFDTSRHILHKGSKPVILFSNVNEMFTDPDDQELTFSVTSGNIEHLVTSIQGDTAIVVSTGDEFTGSEELTIHVFDGFDTLHYQLIVDITSETVMEAAAVPPVISFDGFPDDNIWRRMNWYYIDQVWMPYRASLEANDFSGRYKVAWSDVENVLYFLVETTDDVFVDGYVHNSSPSVGGGYYNYDILEIFIDEDKSGGTHIFDDAGSNAENAFSHHIAINGPEDGGVVTDYVVCDIAGTSWGSYNIQDYSGHFKDFIVRRTGNTLTWEFSLKVYNDTYDNLSPEDSRVNMNVGKVIGLSMAYCDNDNPLEDPLKRDNFIGTDVGPNEALDDWNEHWQNADVYGTMELLTGYVNHAPVIEGSINELVISEYNVAYAAAENLNTLFSDPDEDILVFSIETENSNLEVEITDGNKTMVTAQDGFSGSATVTIMATDSQDTVSIDFTVSSVVSVSDLVRLQKSVLIIPNPVGQTLRIQMDNEMIGMIDITVSDISGRVINKYQVVKTDWLMQYSTDFSFARRGIYLVGINQGNINISKKIIHL